MPYVVSLGVGLGIGAIYALIDVRSPAPPLVALVGLLGMLLGKQAVLRMRGPSQKPAGTLAVSTPGAGTSPTTTSTQQEEHHASA